MRIFSSAIIFKILCWTIAAIFILAGAEKISNPAKFAQDINNYRLLPYFLVAVTAIILPWLEMICGLFLILNFRRLGATFILLLLSFIFLLAISSALLRGLDITCGCFALSEQATRFSYFHLWEDIILLAANLLIYFRTIKTRT